jgi:hypothetical protein
VRSKEKLMAETLYKLFNARVLEWENLAEVANNHQTILIYVPFPRQAYLCSEYEMNQSMTTDQYTKDP